MPTPEFLDPAAYFAGSYADVWRVINPPEQTAAEVSYVLRHLGGASRVLDVMCGAGRHAEPLTDAGLQVTGVDAHAWGPPGTADAGAGWERVVADVTAWEPGRRWEAALCLGNSLTGFDRAQLAALLERMRGWVVPGAPLVVQAWTLSEVAYRRGFEPVTFAVGDFTCEVDGEFHLRPARWHSEQRILRDGHLLESLRSVDYLYGANELEALLADAGFAVDDVHGGFDADDFTFGDPQMLFVAHAV